MSSTMQPMLELCKAAPSPSTEHDDDRPTVPTAERAEWHTVEPDALCTETIRKKSLAPAQSRTTPHGFVICDRQGMPLSWTEHIEVATRRLREVDDAELVRRCADSEVMATKLRRVSSWVPRTDYTPMGTVVDVGWGL